VLPTYHRPLTHSHLVRESGMGPFRKASTSPVIQREVSFNDGTSFEVFVWGKLRFTSLVGHRSMRELGP